MGSLKRRIPNPHASALGKLGGPARSKKLTPARRTEIARKAGLARSQQQSPEERKRLAALGGKASAGIRKTKRKEQP
jgi:general stress protein YciG